MNYFNILVAFAALAAPSMAQSTAACPNKVATYDNPTTPHRPDPFSANQLQYTGFKVVAASPNTTFFTPHSAPNMLSLDSNSEGFIEPANAGNVQHPKLYPGRFYLGCALKDSSGTAKPVTCGVQMATPILTYGGFESVDILLESSKYNGTNLVAAEWGGPETPFINVTVYGAPEGTVLYIDSLQYQVDCEEFHSF